MPTTKKSDHRKAQRSPPRSNAPRPRRDPRVFVAMRRSSAGGSHALLQKSAVSETLGVIANVPRPPTPWRCLREFALAGSALLLNCPSPCARFVKEQRRKIALVGVTPPHPQATALFLFIAFILSRNSAEKFSGHSPLKFSRP